LTRPAAIRTAQLREPAQRIVTLSDLRYLHVKAHRTAHAIERPIRRLTATGPRVRGLGAGALPFLVELIS
jgi:hypothetical protein